MADIDHGITLAVNDINSIADRIAALNVQIQTTEMGGNHANDLRDRRDLLIDELSQMVNVHVFESNGQLSLVVGGVSIVHHSSVTHMQAPAKPGEDVKWKMIDDTEGSAVNVTSGRLAGLQSSRDKTVGYMKQLDALAKEFAEQVNEQHKAGYGLDGSSGIDFFVTTEREDGDASFSASNIFVNDELLQEEGGLALIAAATQDADGKVIPGDGSNALAMAQLRNKLVFAGDGAGATLEQFYEGILGTLGVDAQHAKHLLENQTLLVDQLEMRRSSISGVSLDEEVTNLIQYQQAYNAAARLVTTMDEVLDTLINRTGLIR